MKCKKKLNPWFYIVLLITMYMTTGFMQYKLAPILVYLKANLGINDALAGTLTSIPSLIGLFLTIPLGVVMNKIGPRKMGFLGMGAILIASLVGTFFLDNYYVLVVCQAIYGIGFAAIGITGPYVIVCLFKPEMRGKANGFYITAGTLAQLIMMNLVPRIVTPENLAPAWWFTTIYTVVLLVLWYIFLTDEVAPAPGVSAGEKQSLGKTLAALKDVRILQFFLGGIFFMCSAVAILTFTPTFLVEHHGMDVKVAGSLVSGAALVGAFSTAIGGWLSDTLHTRKWIYVAAIVWMAVSRVLIAVLPMGFALKLVIWGQGLPSVAMGLFYTASGDVIKGNDYAMCCSAISTGTKIGSFIAASLFGIIVTAVGYTASYFVYAAISLGALVGVATVKGIK